MTVESTESTEKAEERHEEQVIETQSLQLASLKASKTAQQQQEIDYSTDPEILKEVKSEFGGMGKSIRQVTDYIAENFLLFARGLPQKKRKIGEELFRGMVLSRIEEAAIRFVDEKLRETLEDVFEVALRIIKLLLGPSKPLNREAKQVIAAVGEGIERIAEIRGIPKEEFFFFRNYDTEPGDDDFLIAA